MIRLTRRSALPLGLVVLLLFTSGCGSGEIPAGWVEHQDEIGFSIYHPDSWVVETRDERWILAHSEADKSFVLIFPFLLPRPMTASQCVRELPALLNTVFPAARVFNVQQRSTQPDEALGSIGYRADDSRGDGNVLDQVVSTLTDRFAEASGQALGLCSIVGRSGMFYAIGAPKERFEAERERLVGILESFSFTEPPAQEPEPPADQGISYVRWVDPREQALSLEVPRGWRAEGGITRGGYSVDVRFHLRLTSPDGHIQITAGDPNIPPHVIPTATSMLAGNFPGSWYDAGYGVPMLVMPFMTGEDYARHYVTESVAQWCPQVQVGRTRDRPDVSRAINAEYQESEAMLLGVFQELSTGDVVFTCGAAERRSSGYYFAGTQFTGQMVGIEVSGVWLANYLYGYVAPSDEAARAEAVLAHLLGSVEMNPRWVQAQQRTTGAAANIVGQTSREIAQIFSRAYSANQVMLADVYRHWSNTTLGLTDVRDEATGEQWKVASGHNYYWRRMGGDAIVGTETFDRPDTDFASLLEF